MAIWRMGQPPTISEGQIVKFDHDGSIWQGQVISAAGKVRVTDAPVKRMVNQVITVRLAQVVAWQPVRRVTAQ